MQITNHLPLDRPQFNPTITWGMFKQWLDALVVDEAVLASIDLGALLARIRIRQKPAAGLVVEGVQ